MSLSILKDLVVFYSSYFTKKDKNIWVFGAIRGQQYTDNAKYLFEYVNQHTDVQAIWISRNNDVVYKLRSGGYQAYLESSREALEYARQAKVAIITHRGNRDKADLPFHAFNKHTKIVQLWHGIPLKKIAFDDTLFSFRHDEHSFSWKFLQFVKDLFFPFLGYVNHPSLILALSEETRDIFTQAFRTPKETVQITGYPRNDALLEHQETERLKQTRKIIYMPTFRGRENSSFDHFLQYGFDVEKLDAFLSKESIHFDIKLHPFNKPSGDFQQQLMHAENISFLGGDDIYETLSEYDLLITDYSSVFFDYLLLNRPIIFAPFGYTDYITQDRSFYFNYDEVTPGPKVSNWGELMEQLSSFSRGSFGYADERESIKNRFHYYQDKHSAPRIYEAITHIATQG